MNRARVVVDVGQCDPDHGSIRRVLEDLGCVVNRAYSGEEAKKLIASHDVALVLVNRVLDQDGSDGVALIKELVQLTAGRDTKIALVSNYPEFQEQAVGYGATRGFGKANLREPETIELLRGLIFGSAA